MAQTAKFQLRQSQGLTQNLALTPQLMQSIKLLQMNSFDLNRYVLDEIEKNPLLELANRSEDGPQERREQISNLAENEPTASDQPKELEGSLRHTSSSQKQSGNTTEKSSASEFSQHASDLEAYIPQQLSLRDILVQQAALSFRSAGEQSFAKEIVENIDEDGYFRADLEALCAAQKCNLDYGLNVLKQVQKFDPPGVGATNLAECMQLQLAEKNRLDPAMMIFTQNLELLAKRDFAALAKLCSVDHEDLIEMTQEIQALEPRPGEAYNSSPVQNIIADVFVKTKADGNWQIELNSQTLPKVLINREYYAEIKELDLGGSDKKFMVDNLQNANWLVASLDQRARTILKVATEIVKQQDMFFSKGEEYLKPLTLKKVAGEIEMHESTVSRVVNNKYLTCERGIFELKFFFMSGVGNEDGALAIGSQSIRLKIKHFIDDESQDNILSDDKLAKMLSDNGISVARRTVTKYRESLGILSSVQRRREKKAFSLQ